MILTLQEQMTLAGLFLTMIGAGLLFFYGVPKKKMGNAILDGEMMMQFQDESVPNVPESEWGPKFNSIINRYKVLNRTGFALLAVGTLVQMLAVLCKA